MEVIDNSILCEKLIKPEIRNLVRIKDAFEDRFNYLRLDKKERLLEFNNDLFEDFKKNIKHEDFSAYYNIESLYRKLAECIGVDKEQILLAAGSDLAIKAVFEACLGKGDHIVLHSPSYAMVRVYAMMFGVEADLVPVKKDWSVDFDTMLAKVDERTKMVVIENPNGFLGTAPNEEKLKAFANNLSKRGVLLLMDEAYFYVENSHSKSHLLIEEYKNILITQTFSKSHGLAGLRVGYLIGDKDLIKHISKVRPMHEISSLSARAAEWVLDNPDLLKENQESIRASKLYLLDELKKTNIVAKDSHANFILLFIPNQGKTSNFTKKLKAKGILIRRPFDEPELRGWFLVCIGTLADSKQFIKAVNSILD